MRELEAKFSVLNPAEFARIGGLDRLGDFVLSPRGVVEFVDTYFDTAGKDLLRANAYLRLRRQPGEVVLTFKRLASSGSGLYTEREEISDSLSSQQEVDFLSGRLSSTATEAARQVVGVEPLEKGITIRNRRTTLIAARGAAELEVALDDLVFEGPRGSARSMEVEVELWKGSPADLDDLSRLFAQREGLSLNLRSKLERALEAVG